ncbi:hypothetical protein MAR_019045 [Mya arenaria]|uniref:SMB domain-containing protein n=1 Tax=Mya arenaria TaxID=6604 RepID=A0ABY7EJH7_MYAAR|nr:hypothetical protein MAR_019045 [Mya arenaria]
MCYGGIMFVASLMVFTSPYVILAQMAPTTPWQNYPTYDFDPFGALKYDSDTCVDRRTCERGITYPDKNCHCDKVCVLMNDCCKGFITEQTLKSISFEVNADHFSCETVNGLTPNVNFGVLIVSKCSQNWTEARTKSLCKSDFHLEEDLTKKRLFRGIICKSCTKICIVHTAILNTTFYFGRRNMNAMKILTMSIKYRIAGFCSFHRCQTPRQENVEWCHRFRPVEISQKRSLLVFVNKAIITLFSINMVTCIETSIVHNAME